MKISINSSDKNQSLELALQIRGSLYTIPVNQYPKKSPRLPTWGKAELSIPEMRRFFVRGCGIAAVCGELSGGFYVLDIECEEAKDAFESLCHRVGLSELIESLYKVKTPGGGFHYGFKCGEKLRTQVLATGRQDMQGAKANGLIIELKGDGGYVLIPPSKGYRQMQGTPFTIPEIDIEEAESLLKIASSLTGPDPSREMSLQPKVESLSGRNSKSSLRRAFDEFERFENFLPQCGWQVSGRHGPLTYWTRPYKTGGTSAVSGYGSDGNFFVNFSSSVEEFEVRRSYTKLQVYSILYCEGDEKLALQMWKEESLSNCESVHAEASFMNGWFAE